MGSDSGDKIFALDKESGLDDPKRQEIEKFMIKYELSYKDGKQMMNAFKMLQARNGQISQKKYENWKNQDKDYLEANQQLSSLEHALGGKLPLLERKQREKIKFDKERFEKLQTLGKSLGGV